MSNDQFIRQSSMSMSCVVSQWERCCMDIRFYLPHIRKDHPRFPQDRPPSSEWQPLCEFQLCCSDREFKKEKKVK